MRVRCRMSAVFVLSQQLQVIQLFISNFPYSLVTAITYLILLLLIYRVGQIK